MGVLCRMKLLNEQHLKGFDNYKYSAIETNPIAVYISQPLFDQVVKLMPKWVAPNLITVVGFMFIVITLAIESIYDYDYRASSGVSSSSPIPSWFWFFASVANILAYVLDGIDGKQARRTGSSTPVGEMFDHGLDSWIVTLSPMILLSVFSRDHLYSIPTYRLLLCIIVGQAIFYTSHWEKYNTGTLYMPWTYDITFYAISVVYLITAIGSYKLWYFRVGTLNMMNILEIGLYLSFGISIVVSIYNIIKSENKKTLAECLRPIWPPMAMFTISACWGYLSPTNVLDKDPRTFFWIVGVMFTNITCRLIIAQMSKTRSQLFHWILVPYLLVFLVTFASPFVWTSLELWILRLFAAFVTLVHLHYAYCVINQLCAHFKIRCFSLKPVYDTLPSTTTSSNVSPAPPELQQTSGHEAPAVNAVIDIKE